MINVQMGMDDIADILRVEPMPGKLGLQGLL